MYADGDHLSYPGSAALSGALVAVFDLPTAAPSPSR